MASDWPPAPGPLDPVPRSARALFVGATDEPGAEARMARERRALSRRRAAERLGRLGAQ